MVLMVTVATADVALMKTAVLAPDGIVTVAGTWTAVLSLVRLTTVADRAAPVSVTVPFEEVPPITSDGLTTMDASAGGSGVTVSAVFCVELP